MHFNGHHSYQGCSPGPNLHKSESQQPARIVRKTTGRVEASQAPRLTWKSHCGLGNLSRLRQTDLFKHIISHTSCILVTTISSSAGENLSAKCKNELAELLCRRCNIREGFCLKLFGFRKLLLWLNFGNPDQNVESIYEEKKVLPNEVCSVYICACCNSCYCPYYSYLGYQVTCMPCPQQLLS